MRGDSSYSSSSSKYPVQSWNNDVDTNDNGFQITDQDEEWITKKRVTTVTRKNLEKQSQRQVVLEDGRIVQEDDPEVTNDLIEDTQTHEEGGDEDRQFGSLSLTQGSGYGKGSTVLGERFSRNTNTRDVSTKSLSTAAANNLGEIARKDVEDVRSGAKHIRSVLRPYDNKDGSYPLTIPARIIHKDKSHNRTVNREDIHEVDRMHEGRLKTDRYD